MNGVDPSGGIFAALGAVLDLKVDFLASLIAHERTHLMQAFWRRTRWGDEFTYEREAYTTESEFFKKRGIQGTLQEVLDEYGTTSANRRYIRNAEASFREHRLDDPAITPSRKFP